MSLGPVVVLAGGVGAARFLRGLVRVVPPEEIVVIGNTGDDMWWHGLYIAPDLDSQLALDFYARALSAHGLAPLGTTDLNDLPTEIGPGRPLVGGIGVRSWSGSTYWIQNDPRLSYLYDNATLLQQSSFDLDAGEATGATLAGKAALRAAPTSVHRTIPYADLLVSSLVHGMNGNPRKSPWCRSGIRI